jgi:hypothetical protein
MRQDRQDNADGRDFHHLTVTITAPVSTPPPLDQVGIYSKAYVHRYWAYRCSDENCWRVKDEFEGPDPAAEQAPNTLSVPIVVPPGATSSGPLPHR